ncbi:MAG TPA: dihydroorotase [Gammaproteobacteria bacterium]|nr:dihydroorotase [Gammaproteobacteria bacterium]
MKRLLILNATLVNEGRTWEADVAIQNGRIEHIGSGLKPAQDDQVIDAAGKLLLPGMIDDQVHFREPGLTHKGDIATESRAAVAGGITSYMEMPNVNPPTLNAENLEAKYQLAAQKSLANHAFYLGASNDNLDDIKALDPRAACGVKIFMGASTGNMLVDDPKILEGIFAHSPVLIATHCEDTPTILANEARYKQQFGDKLDVEYHPLIRSEEACYKSSLLAVDLARRHGAKLHVLHLTTAKELSLFSKGEVGKKQITVEACVHHLFFNQNDYAAKGNFIKCNPSIKTPADQAALIRAVDDDLIDIVATDHAPHTLEEKQRPYLQAPSGLPLVQYALLSMLEHYFDGRFSLEKIVQKTSHAPALRFDVRERGFIREGWWADLVLVDPRRSTQVERAAVLSKCGWSPFEGYTFRSSIDTTLVNGRIVYRNGEIDPAAGLGKRLQFNR